MEAYEKEISKATLKTFKDKPDEVSIYTLQAVSSNSFKVSWVVPESNNCPITEFKVFLSEKVLRHLGSVEYEPSQDKHKFRQIGTTTLNEFEFCELDANCAYYVTVTAINAEGEGYKSEQPFMVRTLNGQPTSSIWVWGSNFYSQLGLSNEQAENEDYEMNRERCCQKKPLNQSQFRACVEQVACGDKSSLVLCSDEGSQFLISMGFTIVVKEIHQNKFGEATRFTSAEAREMLEYINSNPFMIDLDCHVVKVI